MAVLIAAPFFEDKVSDLPARVISQLNQGDYLVLHNQKVTLCFHQCTQQKMQEAEITKYLEQHTVLCVDFKEFPELLDADQVPNTVLNYAKPCTCSIKTYIFFPPRKHIPHTQTLIYQLPHEVKRVLQMWREIQENGGSAQKVALELDKES